MIILMLFLSASLLFVLYQIISGITISSDWLNILLTAAATFIAIAQACHGLKKIKEKHDINVKIRDLVKKIKKPQSGGELYKRYNEDYKDKIPQLKRLLSYAAAFSGLSNYESLIKEYSDYISSIESLYRGMLEFEKEFSLSYGFGRYIDAFRNILPDASEKFARVKSAYDALMAADAEKPDHSIPDIHKSDKFNDALSGFITAMAEDFGPMVEDLHKLEPYLKELYYKFPDSANK